MRTMDQTIRLKRREGALTDVDRRRAGLPTKEEITTKCHQQKIDRILRFMEENGYFDSGQFNVFFGIAGEHDDMVIAGDWNNISHYVDQSGPKQRITIKRWVTRYVKGQTRGKFVPEETYAYLPGVHITDDTTPSRLESILERLGVETVWGDEYRRCDCGKGFRVVPDSHNWEMYGWIEDGDYGCGDCQQEDI